MDRANAIKDLQKQEELSEPQANLVCQLMERKCDQPDVKILLGIEEQTILFGRAGKINQDSKNVLKQIGIFLS